MSNISKQVILESNIKDPTNKITRNIFVLRHQECLNKMVNIISKYQKKNNLQINTPFKLVPEYIVLKSTEEYLIIHTTHIDIQDITDKEFKKQTAKRILINISQNTRSVRNKFLIVKPEDYENIIYNEIRNYYIPNDLDFTKWYNRQIKLFGSINPTQIIHISHPRHFHDDLDRVKSQITIKSKEIILDI